MPVYEYYCRACGKKFEQLRPMKSAEQPAICPQGHAGATRTVSVFAPIGRGEQGQSVALGGSCACGGACACGGHS